MLYTCQVAWILLLLVLLSTLSVIVVHNMPNESFTFSYDVKRGLEIEFKAQEGIWESRVVQEDWTLSNISQHSSTRKTGCRHTKQGTRARGSQ
jgi:hypothetical protein